MRKPKTNPKNPDSRILGRPTKYKPEYCEMLIDHLSEGYSLNSFAAVINVSKDTLKEWMTVHPIFSASEKLGREKQVFFYEKLFKKGSLGAIPNFNSTAAIWLSKNMLGWRDRAEVEQTIKFDKDIESLSVEQLKKEITKLIK